MGRYKRYNEHNPVQNYFSEDSHTSELVSEMRKGILTGRKPRFGAGLIASAQSEVDAQRTTLDQSTHPFAQDLANTSFRDYTRKGALLVVDGLFYARSGAQNLDSVLGIDITQKVHELFKKHSSRGTIDAYVSRHQTDVFLNSHRRELLQRQLDLFRLRASKFFYFDLNDLSAFSEGSGVDMARLVPLITEIGSYVFLTPSNTPRRSEYNEAAPRFVSYRLKRSIASKILYKLFFPIPIEERNVITDWAAHRVVVADEAEARDLESHLRGSPRIGNSKVEFVDTRDYYANKKRNEFRNFNVIAIVTTKGYEPATREIQIVDRDQYYRNEVDPRSPANHRRFKERQAEKLRRLLKRDRKLREFHDYYRVMLDDIFGREEIIIQI